jgi:predicted RND superfamily exporter protein
MALAAVAGLASRHLQFDRSVENMFASDDPLLKPYRMQKRAFGANEIVLVAYVDQDLMTAAGMQRLEDLCGQLSALPGIDTVLSMGRGPLGANIISKNPLARSLLKLYEGYTVGADRETTAVVCVLAPTRVSRGQTIDAIRRILAAEAPGGVVVGVPVMVVDGFRYLERDGLLLGIVSVLLLIMVIVFCFRSLRWVLIPLAVTQWTLICTKAALVASQLPLTLVSSMLGANITIIGVATTVHIIVRYRELRDEGLAAEDALRRATTELAAPIFWACATDTIGFGSLLLSHVGPVHDFGLMMVIGSTLVIAGLLLLVPGLALAGRRRGDPRRAWGEHHLDASLRRISTSLALRPKAWAWGSALVCSVAALGYTRLEVETDFMSNFRSDSPLVHSYRFVESRLGGAGVWDCLVPITGPLNGEQMERLRHLEARLRDEVRVRDGQGRDAPGLTKVMSIVDALDAATLGRLKHVPIAALRDRVIAAALSQVESDLPTMFRSLVAVDPDQPDKRYVRVMLRSLERQPADQKRAVIEKVRAIAREEFPGADVTGFFVLLTSLIDSTTRDQWLTFAASTGGIFLMMVVAFRSVPLALVALVPNALPIFVATGLWGWLGLKINMGAAMIAAVSMGLSVDSSVHYITVFLHRRKAGDDFRTALDAAHQTVGRAMVFSTLALVVGFSALCLSEFVPTIYFGALVGLTMLGGLAGNLVVLPLLLTLVNRREGN